MKNIHIYMMILLLVITGCAMKEAPPLRTYTLNAGNVPVSDAKRYKAEVIKVSYPQTLKEAITERMAFSYSSSDRGYYQNSQWSNNLGKLVQGNIIEVLQESGMFKAVLPYASTAEEDLRLEITIHDFSHHVRKDVSFAVVSIGFSLIDTKTGRLLKSRRFSYREVTPTVNAKGYVVAVNRAMHRLNFDLIHWLR
jgi:cholesterol transport system auxiliary component